MSDRRALLVFALLAASGALAQAPAVPGPSRAAMQVAPAPATGTAIPVAPATEAAEAPELGRLFFTPAERHRLDESRRRPAQTPSVATATPELPSLPPRPEYVTLNGVVRRNDGTTTVWLNNKPVRGTQSVEGLVVAPGGRSNAPANVTVQIPQTGRSVDLRVGQQLELHSGQVQEAYRAPRAAAAQATQAAPSEARAEDAAARAAPRRTNRERDLLRDLLREIDGPEQGQRPPSAGAKPENSPSDARR